MSVIVIDNGSGFCKAGFAGESSPRIEFPSVIGRPRYVPVVAGVKYRNLYIGGSAQARRGVLSLSYPIRSGIVNDWKDLTTVWDHTFKHLLEIEPSDYQVIVTEAPKNPLKNRERMLEILFERFRVQGAFVAIQGVLALYTGGRTTGMVFDSGEGVSHTVPVYEGYAIHHAIERVEYAGKTLTDYLLNLLTERGYYFTTTAEIEIVREIKEKLCFVSHNFMDDMRLCAREPGVYDERYQLPDGQVLTVGTEKFRCPEVLFRPTFLNLDCPGIQGYLYDSVMCCDIDIRRDIMDNVVLSGGNTLFRGIADRLQDELDFLCPCPVHVRSIPERRYAVWLGGSILGSLSSFKDIAVSRAEYDDYGPRIVHRKCF